MQGKRQHFMPIFVRHCHFLNNFLNIFVCSLHSPVHLRPIGGGVMMLDFEILTHVPDHFVIQIGAIVSNDLPRESVPTNQLPLYQSDHHTPRNIGIGSRFDPFGEIIYRHENETMAIRSLGLDGPDDVYSLHGKRPRGGHDI